MKNIQKKSWERVLDTLKERAKELNCLYRIEEILNDLDLTLDEMFQKIVKALPPGWQYPAVCKAIITYQGKQYKSSHFQKSPWVLKSEIMVQDEVVGQIEVYYTEEKIKADEGPFLKEERTLVDHIAERLGHYLLHRQLRDMFQNWQTVQQDMSEKRMEEWRVIVDLLHRTDQNLYIRISRKMINYLSWQGVNEAQQLLQYFVTGKNKMELETKVEINQPQEKIVIHNIMQLSNYIFDIAGKNLSPKEIFSCVQKWIYEDKSSFLIRTLENQHSTLLEITDAITRYFHLAPEGVELSESIQKAMIVSLIRRFFTDQLEFINIAKNYIEVSDFNEILQHLIYPPGSQGKLGGKSAGQFLAYRILRKMSEKEDLFQDIKIPKTWYISSDGLLAFLQYNNLEEIAEQKYKEVGQIRHEYPHLVQLCKSSQFPPEIIKGLSMVLDDLGDRPLIVRSSSLLEDRLGSAFSGKYKSLFLANQGSKEENLEALCDAIAEVYASTFGPDPIEYRAARGLLDFHEEMAIMIQEVVGSRVGKYFLPAFAGVAFSHNEFRWSPRIKREDGLLRIVPGLGTRAVDRLSDDYPVLIAPGRPELRVNVTVDEIVRYSPKKIDVIDLEENSFKTLDFSELFQDVGENYPQFHKILSVVKDDHIQKVAYLSQDIKENKFIVTFDGYIANHKLIHQMKGILEVLQQELNTPVDIEFAHDGTDFYVLQCRPQSFAQESVAMPIPKDIPEDRILFSANRYISNGYVPDITHIVYVDPERYSEIDNLDDLKMVGRAVSKLNKLLPKKRFILMGPGRWGSRGDIKLGVSVTYADINNTAVLIEIARQKGNYLPDLSFGTHFFQDLVESSIRYLPLYPDDNGVIFNRNFLLRSDNILTKMVPEFQKIAEVVRVVDVPQITNGSILRILLNADLNEGVAILSSPSERFDQVEKKDQTRMYERADNWRWRMRMVEQIATDLDGERFGVKAFYVFGSTKNAMAGPSSDIDIMVHFMGSVKQKQSLLMWLEGWSLCLSRMNYVRTGYKTDGLLDIHLVSDEDVAKKRSYASKIGAVTDAAKQFPLKNQS